MLIALETSPADCAERGELYQIASTLVTALPEDCRTAFVLTQLDGYSYDEAAAIQQEPRGTIASRVHRARRILLEQMGHCLGEKNSLGTDGPLSW
jgi:RNA polymerase sigma-70 factor (ECF subfamily)